MTIPKMKLGVSVEDAVCMALSVPMVKDKSANNVYEMAQEQLQEAATNELKKVISDFGFGVSSMMGSTEGILYVQGAIIASLGMKIATSISVVEDFKDRSFETLHLEVCEILVKNVSEALLKAVRHIHVTHKDKLGENNREEAIQKFSELRQGRRN